ncbi:hypothetical protein OJ252_1371 [Cryptosporidium canis]|uniref:Uncharacterized protein n=1 Tax=Cryptosporidium canis TaxID=195482 RepID=A0ABQ8PB74_9CRYT|nr:hypothetical protein OJ252_1371 [Cryptosporidium canis]
MESIVNAISDGICCLQNYILRGEEHFNETYQDVNDYYSYFNTKPSTINNDLLERSLFTSKEHGVEYLELSRNNKLFGSPVSLKSYIQTPNNKVNQRVFERLEIAQADIPVKTGCQLKEPINYYKSSEIEKAVIVPRSKLVYNHSNAPSNQGSNQPSLAPVAASPKPNAWTEAKVHKKEEEPLEKPNTHKKNLLEVPISSIPQARSNPPATRIYENPIKKTPSMPSIKQYKTASRCPEPLVPENESPAHGENNVALTKYGAYLLGL